MTAAFEPATAARIPGEFTTRLARRDDLTAILSVENASQPSPWTERVFAREFDIDYSRCWVVEDGEHAIVAFLVFWIVHDEIHVLNVAVHPDARRRGIARALLDDLIEQAEAAHMTLISLEVRDSNVAAQRLYSGFGFEKIGHRPRYYADNQEDARVLALLLSESG